MEIKEICNVIRLPEDLDFFLIAFVNFSTRKIEQDVTCTRTEAFLFESAVRETNRYRRSLRIPAVHNKEARPYEACVGSGSELGAI